MLDASYLRSDTPIPNELRVRLTPLLTDMPISCGNRIMGMDATCKLSIFCRSVASYTSDAMLTKFLTHSNLNPDRQGLSIQPLAKRTIGCSRTTENAVNFGRVGKPLLDTALGTRV